MNIPTEKLTSLQLEKTYLGGLIKIPEVLYETELFMRESDFSNSLNQSIFSITRKLILEGQEPNKTIIAQKVKELNLSFKDPISPFDYIDAITFSQVNKKGAINAAKEIVKLRIRRDLYEDAQEIQNFILSPKCGEKTIAEIIAEVDGITNKRISAITTEEEPIDLYAGIEEFFKNLAANPVEEVGLITPFSQFNRFFGGLRSKNGIYNIISRSGEGKSAFLFNMAKGVALLNDCPVLILDTEMSYDLNRFRAGAAETGVNAWYLETGKWINNEEIAKKVMDAFPKFKKYEGKVFHKQVPNKDIKEILGIIRKWYFKHVGRGNKALVIYDYLKITSDSDKNRQEYQQLGDKVSLLNEIGFQLDIPIWSAGQQNRTAESQGQRNDDSTTAAASDRINQYAIFNGTFRKKTLEEINEHGVKFGSHLLKPFKVSRTQGKDSYFNNNLVRVVEPSGLIKYRQNFINYDICEYNITEKGTYQEIVDEVNMTASIKPDEKTEEQNSDQKDISDL